MNGSHVASRSSFFDPIAILDEDLRAVNDLVTRASRPRSSDEDLRTVAVHRDALALAASYDRLQVEILDRAVHGELRASRFSSSVPYRRCGTYASSTAFPVRRSTEPR